MEVGTLDASSVPLTQSEDLVSRSVTMPLAMSSEAGQALIHEMGLGRGFSNLASLGYEIN